MASADDGKLSWGVLGRAVGPRARLLRNVLTTRNLAALAPFGLPTGSLSIMALISANEGCSQTMLARQTGMNKSALVGVLDELERRGIAKRTVAAEDRRRNVLSLTPEGARLMDEMQRAANAEEEPIRKALSDEELTQLISLMERAYDALGEGD